MGDAQFLLLQPIHQKQEERSGEEDNCMGVEEVDMQNRHTVGGVDRLVHTLSPMEPGIVLLRTSLALLRDILGQLCRCYSLCVDSLQNNANDLATSHGSI